jgi:hypothetical protein
VNLTNGNLTPFVQHLNTTKGLVYVDPSGSVTQLALNGSMIPSATATRSSSGGSSDTGLIVGIVAAALVVLVGGYWLVRRKPTAA